VRHLLARFEDSLMSVIKGGFVVGPKEGTRWLDGVSAGPSGKVRVRLSPDDLVDLPVEVEEVDGPAFNAAVSFVGLQPREVGGIFAYVSPEMLGISTSLAEELRSFQRWWEQHSDPFDDDEEDNVEDNAVEGDPAWEQWHATGWDLVERLQAELGSRYEVSWAGQKMH
jgi:hypothetical protein